MYKLSDLSNLEHESYLRKKNPIDRFLEIEGVLPHRNTLADGYAKATTYEKPVIASLKSRNTRAALTERKGSSPGDFEVDTGLSTRRETHSIFKQRSKTIANTSAAGTKYAETKQSTLQAVGVRSGNLNVVLADALMKPNQYRSRLSEIENKRTAARKMEILKLSNMSE